MSIQRPCLFLVLALSALAVQAGNRSIATPVRVAAGNTTAARGLFAGDFNADGKQDVLLVEEKNVRVVPGNGNGTFRSSIATFIGDYVPEGLADFNRDGRPDVYMSIRGGDAAVMDGNADGTFGNLRTVGYGLNPDQLVAGDFTGDGLLDLAGVSHELASLVIYPGNGAGAFSTATRTSLPVNHYMDAAAGDFDHDGRLDVVMTGLYHATFAWNTGASFAMTSFDTVGGLAVTAGDVNGDGTTDAAAFGQRHAIVWLGNPSRSLAFEGVLVTSDNEQEGQVGVAMAQLDGDGRADLIVADLRSNVTVVSHDGASLRPARSFRAGAAAILARVAAADFTGDGKADAVHVAARHDRVDDFFSLLRGHGDGTFGAPVVLDIDLAVAAVPPYTFDFAGHTWVSDVNGDGRPDVVASVENLDGSSLAVLPGRSDGTFGAAVFTPLRSSADSWVVDAADLNGDGRADAVHLLGSTGEPWTLEVYFGQSNGTFVTGPVTTFATPPGLLRRILDYTGDGRADVLDSAGRLFPGAGGGTFGAPIATGIGPFSWSDVIGDVNGDARPDVATLSGNKLDIHINKGGGSFTKLPTASSVAVYALEDLNGDGFAESIAESILMGVGDGTFTRRGFKSDVTTSVRVADVDGDGHNDVVAPEGVYFGTGDGAFDHVAQTSAKAGQVISTADYDGNGSPDIWSHSWGILSIVRTRTGTDGTTAPQLSVSTAPNPTQWGQAVIITATVGTSTGLTARGSVLFRNGDTPSEIKRVGDDGGATFGTIFPVGTTSNITVAFTGDEHHAPASASTSHTTTRAETTLTVTTNGTTYESGTVVIIRGSLKGKYGGSPTGTITYRKGSTVLTSLPTNATQLFTSSNPALFTVGTHTITAEYTGDANYLASQSAPVTITITRAVPTMTLTLPAPPVTTGQHPLTASFTTHWGVTGTVAFSCFGQLLGTATISNGQAVLTAKLPAGSGTCTASYPGNDSFFPSSASANATVYLGGMPTAPTVRATYSGGGNVTVNISPISGAATYDIYRGVNGAPLTLLTSTSAVNAVVTFGAPEVTTAVYAVKARDANGTATPMGPLDLATNVAFTNDPLVAGLVVRAQHVVQLQAAINAVRRAAGLAQVTFDAPTVGAKITAARIYAMRDALKEARSALGLSTTFTDTLVSKVRAVHMQELRDGVK